MNIVIVGAGLAGAKAVEELREQGYDGEITLIGAEPHPPYERPPLSKSVMLGEKEPDSVFVHDRDWYAGKQIDLRTGTRVVGLDTENRRIALADGEVGYDQVLLATGSRPRRLSDLDAIASDDVFYLRTIEDAEALRARLQSRMLIIGAGWIGLEIAAAARQAGGSVTVVEQARHPLAAVLGPEIAEVFAGLHREHGVDLRTGTSITSMRRHDGALRIELDDGETLEPEIVVVGIGATPRVELAEKAGLEVDNGIVVDASLRTATPGVLAAGDVARHRHPLLGRGIRVEHWDNAIEQGKHAARVMLGDEAPYERLPYFFTDQYDLGIEYVGDVGPDGYDEVVVRGDLAGRVFRAYWVRGGTVVAAMHANDWDAIDEIRAAVGGPILET